MARKHISIFWGSRKSVVAKLNDDVLKSVGITVKPAVPIDPPKYGYVPYFDPVDNSLCDINGTVIGDTLIIDTTNKLGIQFDSLIFDSEGFVIGFRLFGKETYIKDNNTIYQGSEAESEILAIIQNLENKEDKDTIYDDTSLWARIEDLENDEDYERWLEYDEDSSYDSSEEYEYF